MAILRDRPYLPHNFLVDLGNGNSDGPEAGFAEVSGLSMSVDTVDYRNGNAREASPIKLTGLNRVADVTLRRGVIGSLALYQWLDEIRNGNTRALRTVTIQLMLEDQSAPVMTWKLLRARIVRHSVGPLNARGTGEVAVEEMTLAYERLEME